MAVAVANSSEISRVRAPNVGTPSSLRRSLIARESEMASWRSSSMSTPAGSASIFCDESRKEGRLLSARAIVGKLGSLPPCVTQMAVCIWPF